MKKKEGVKYFNKEWKKMTAHLKIFLEGGDQEELHQFRVQVKKIRAMLSLFESTSGRHQLLKDFRPVRKIFKYAGHIRDAYTNLKLGEHYRLKNEQFETGQKRVIEQGITEFKRGGKKFLKEINVSHGALEKKLPKIKEHLIAEFYKKYLEQIAVNLEISRFDEDMHSNRKIIKILIYNHKLADKALNGYFRLSMEYLDKLQNSIGKWHDNLLAAELFSSPELNDKPVVININRKNAGIKRTIKSLGRDFLNKATLDESATKRIN